ncbi:hypothetical protein K439DRAFT_474271 [Ramaria rubella]|nr:hypothetical protein K439DRAFT_474271 [Ramaria rubella]
MKELVPESARCRQYKMNEHTKYNKFEDELTPCEEGLPKNTCALGSFERHAGEGKHKQAVIVIMVRPKRTYVVIASVLDHMPRGSIDPTHAFGKLSESLAYAEHRDGQDPTPKMKAGLIEAAPRDSFLQPPESYVFNNVVVLWVHHLVQEKSRSIQLLRSTTRGHPGVRRGEIRPLTIR